MGHSLVAVVPELTAEHRARLREAAARYGFECHICVDAALRCVNALWVSPAAGTKPAFFLRLAPNDLSAARILT